MWRRVGLAVLDDPVVSWLGESMAASSGSTSPEPTCRLVASQSSHEDGRIRIGIKDQDQQLSEKVKQSLQLQKVSDQLELNWKSLGGPFEMTLLSS